MRQRPVQRELGIVHMVATEIAHNKSKYQKQPGSRYKRNAAPTQSGDPKQSTSATQRFVLWLCLLEQGCMMRRLCKCVRD